MKEIINVGVDVKEQGLFEGQYAVPDGMAYNSYLLMGKVVCLFDTVDKLAESEWLDNLKASLSGRSIDYIIISHVEPDHSYSLAKLLSIYPSAKVVATSSAFKMLAQFYALPLDDRKIVVKDGDCLTCGEHKLQFFTAPMVHWPEVMVTFDHNTGTLFSADAFGRFGISSHDEDWAEKAREYYINIVGKYGVQTQNLLKKLANLPLKSICPLHGNVLSDNLEYYINLYDIWSSYTPEDQGVFIAYTTVYGNTELVAKRLYDTLKAEGINCTISNLVYSEMSENIEQAFKYSHMILATTTYENSIFPAMNDYLNHLTHKGYQKRHVGIIENGSWAPTAQKLMREKLSGMKDITILEPSVTILSSPNDATWESIGKLVQSVKDTL